MIPNQINNCYYCLDLFDQSLDEVAFYSVVVERNYKANHNY